MHYIGKIKMLYMYKICILLFIIALTGCQKHDLLNGEIIVTGNVSDIISGEPIPNTIIQLTKVIWVGGLYGLVEQDMKTVDTTDAFGNYSFSILAEGEYEFNILADPQNIFYVPSLYSVGIVKTVKSIGYHTIDLPCHRSAWAEILLTNVAPIDTPYFISLSGNLESIDLFNFYKDTLVYLKLIGRPEYPNNLRFNKDNILDSTFDVTAYPWDTINLGFQY